ncbi:MAG: FimB/Mfa2 family fimbrial subunit [Massilibacteroides sp.]|nr:FimB/Mfa2 family fimbrial subunit [Massilibacteroides sp.]MDD4114192.1 FimB/Mfa2 family fimbrial subunit [Massilibacteroides sp.]MDD4660540.1 FimB/Mfa2 family fimbrial subunit [Massilibacteroides sp.]
MKKIFFLFTVFYLSVFFLPSCSGDAKKFTDNQIFPVCLVLKNDIEISPFPFTKSIPAYTPSDPHSLSGENTSLFTRIEYMVFQKEDDVLIKQKTLTKENSDDFGAYIYDELKAGIYRIVLFAHSASEMNLTDYSLSGTDLSDSFYAIKEITVGTANEDTPVEITLKRIVAKITLCATKEVPQKATKFILEISERYNELDIKSGTATTPQSLRKEYPLSPNNPDGIKPDYSFYTFIPAQEEGDTTYLGSIKLITLDSRNDTLHTHLIPSVPVMRNRITHYSGSLYAPDTNPNTINLDIEDQGAWKDSINIHF